MQIREVMSGRVRTIRMAAPVAEAAAVLVDRGFTAVPVIDDAGFLVGIVTEADLMMGRLPPESVGASSGTAATVQAATVADVMKTDVVVLTPGADIAHAAKVMLDKRIRALPVVDGGKVVGIVTRRDVLRTTVPNTRRAAASRRRPSPLDFDFEP